MSLLFVGVVNKNMCDDPVQCGFACPPCQDRLAAMSLYLAVHHPKTYRCGYCGTRPVPSDGVILHPLTGNCVQCQLQLQCLHDWLYHTPCNSCGQIPPYASRAVLYDSESLTRIKFGDIVGKTVSQAYDYYNTPCFVLCRMCDKDLMSAVTQTSSKQTSKKDTTLQDIADCYKLDRGQCKICRKVCTRGNLGLFEWDHIYPSHGERPCVSTLARKGRSVPNLEALQHEIGRCRLLCLNCHDAQTRWQSENIYKPLRFLYWDHAGCAKIKTRRPR